jgi:hypothetical protein
MIHLRTCFSIVPAWVEPDEPASTNSSPTPGTRLDRYEIECMLGAGGMGEVFRARDTRLNRAVGCLWARRTTGTQEIAVRTSVKIRVPATRSKPLAVGPGCKLHFKAPNNG